MVGLIGAMAVEVEGLIAQLEDRQETSIGMDTFFSGRLFGREAVLAVCGPGKVNAAMCTSAMILHFHPEWIVNLGVAGAGIGSLEIGDLVAATAAVQHDVDTSAVGDPIGLVSRINLIQLPCDANLRSSLVAAAQQCGLRIHEGIVATGDQFVNRSEVRSLIHERFDAMAIEMEGGAVAHACYLHHVPCAVLRSISDHANGQSDMDYPTFTRLAASHSQQVIETLLRGNRA